MQEGSLLVGGTDLKPALYGYTFLKHLIPHSPLQNHAYSSLSLFFNFFILWYAISLINLLNKILHNLMIRMIKSTATTGQSNKKPKSLTWKYYQSTSPDVIAMPREDTKDRMSSTYKSSVYRAKIIEVELDLLYY